MSRRTNPKQVTAELVQSLQRENLEQLCVQLAQSCTRSQATNKANRRLASKSLPVYQVSRRRRTGSSCNKTSEDHDIDATDETQVAIYNAFNAAKSAAVTNDELHRGSAHRYLTIRGGLSLALRRTAANIAAGNLGIALQIDLSRRQIVNQELALRASLLASSISFHRTHMAELQLQEDEDSPEGKRKWRFCGFCIRGDATNAQVWQKQKLRAQEMLSYFHTEFIDPTDDWSASSKRVAFNKVLGPLLPVRDSTSQHAQGENYN